MITLDVLAGELKRRKLSDWSVIERVIRRGTARIGGGLDRLDDETRIGLVVHHDVGRGRGTGEVELDGDRGDDAAAIVADAETRASGMIGPPWSTPAPAAPARVELEDPAIAGLRAGTAAGVLATLTGVVEGEAILEHHIVRLATGGVNGRTLAVHWRETRVAVRLVAEHAGHTMEISAEARRIGDLRLAERLRQAVADLAERATATTPAAGAYPVVLHAAAHAHGGYGLWEALVTQADAALVRQGLSRYRPGGEIVPGSATRDEPLDVTSDGTLAWGVRSAPTGDHGEPVRKFAVVERGIARGLSLDQREAAFAHSDANGGIRNLVISGGATGADELVRVTGGPIVEVRRFAWMDLDPRNGSVVARIETGAVHDATGRRPITGGTLRVDAVAGLAVARRSKELVTEGPVRGPVAIRLEGIAVT